ncbi:DUF3500 domain-containing protein [Algibacter mikhailovii]|uniref:DUF3500 domain-containing protein n=1 Tax=Algibacter mikhailovii TaxID=425498 RepID=A0A918R911_9FLAO|nr:DUF3500 domain-containing protein [Algibacter mikhailovii]GGZ90076.1 hypothetical protein GCM10007028_30560 [Algibacter mikhailovii]
MRKLFTIILALQFICSFSQTTEELVTASNLFLETLNEQENKEILQKFSDSLRTEWTNLPSGMVKRPGKKLGDLSNASKTTLHELLITIFSSQGYLKVTSIMQLDDILNNGAKAAFEEEFIKEKLFLQTKKLGWNYNNFFISIWNQPSLTKPWGIKFEGHHLSINITVFGEHVSFTPMFIGAGSEVLPFTKHIGLRYLSKEEDYGIKLINSFNEEQKKQATLNEEVPKDIITNPDSDKRITDYNGIKAEHLTNEQKQLLMLLIKEYVNNLENDKAQENLDKIKTSGVENIYFAWIGSYQSKAPHYYIINGPDFIIEYDNVGFRNNGDHIHAIWREKINDFGEDILKTHHLKHKH